MSKSQSINTETVRNMADRVAQELEQSLQVVETGDSQEDKLKAAGRKARLAPRPEAARVDTVTEKFAGFRLTINRDPIGKKKDGNGLLIGIDGDRTNTTIRMSLREARAMRSFLDRNIPVETKNDAE